MKISDKLSCILSLPAGYRLFRRVLGGDKVWRTYMDEYVRPVRGEKVLDIGCGPADVLNYLPDVDYMGVDISREYIDAAKKRFGKKGRFCCSDVGLTTVEQERGTFSLVLATGVLHHLDADTAGKLFDLARLALSPNGRLITFDGCYVPRQSTVARWMLSRDRGQFVRNQSEYEYLAGSEFSKVESFVRHDLLRLPYTHLIMRCAN